MTSPAPRKGEPFSIRLSSVTDEYVAAEARRRRWSKSAVVESLTEEAARTRRFAGIGFRGGVDDRDRRAWLIGTAFDVWQVIEATRSGDGLADPADGSDLTERHVHLAHAYYDEYPEEIEEFLAEQRRPVVELLRQYPFIQVEYVD